MATIDLGKIKPVWKGDWAGSTAYEKNDMVLEGANSYICTAAHTSSGTFSSDSANWDVMAYGAELPAQSGNAGLALKTDGTNLSWGTAGGVLQVKETLYTGETTSTASSYSIISSSYSVAITPTSANSSFLLEALVHLGNPHHDTAAGLTFFDSQVGTSTSDSNSLTPINTLGSRTGVVFSGSDSYGSADGTENHILRATHISLLYTPSSQNTNSRTFYVAWKRNSDVQAMQINAAQTNNTRSLSAKSLIRVTEIAGGIVS